MIHLSYLENAILLYIKSNDTFYGSPVSFQLTATIALYVMSFKFIGAINIYIPLEDTLLSQF